MSGEDRREVSVEVPQLLDQVRVDRAVSMLTGVSRAEAAGLVRDGRVAVDGRAATSGSTPLAAGHRLEISLATRRPGTVLPEPGVPFTVVHHDDDLVVVDKPAGVVVHPGAGRSTGTLVAGLLHRYPDLAGLVDRGVCDPLRPGLVHRLDAGTSGLLVVARTERAFRSLSGQLAERTVDRSYLALVSGLVADDRGLVEAPIGRSVRQPTRMAVSAQGREARTAYRVLRRYDDRAATLLQLTLETGRTHQIRVHLAAIGHPVVGDDRYGAPATPAGGGALPEGRLFLHAFRLGFVHPADGERHRWQSPLPDDLAASLGERPPLPD